MRDEEEKGKGEVVKPKPATAKVSTEISRILIEAANAAERALPEERDEVYERSLAEGLERIVEELTLMRKSIETWQWVTLLLTLIFTGWFGERLLLVWLPSFFQALSSR